MTAGTLLVTDEGIEVFTRTPFPTTALHRVRELLPEAALRRVVAVRGLDVPVELSKVERFAGEDVDTARWDRIRALGKQAFAPK